jgi:hypothetical protein
MESETEAFTKRLANLKEKVVTVEQAFLDQVDREDRYPEAWRLQGADLRGRLAATEARFRKEMESLEIAITSLQTGMKEALQTREKFVTGLFFQEQVKPLKRSIELLREDLQAAENKLAEIKKLKA